MQKHRNYKNMNPVMLKEDFVKGINNVEKNSASQSINDLVNSYNSVDQNVLDKHAPRVNKKVSVRLSAPWITPDIKNAKRKRRQAERRWRKNGLTVHRQDYKSCRNTVTDLIMKAKRKHYCDKISSTDNSKELFSNNWNFDG